MLSSNQCEDSKHYKSSEKEVVTKGDRTHERLCTITGPVAMKVQTPGGEGAGIPSGENGQH